ncbi:MAG: InlB B-repeat-containing protein [Actinomycetales bacterium]|nr:InlB B-repeat-containing protein [Actinomycetales bacterium]
MKKILVAIATAAMTFAGLAAPAHAATIDASNNSQYVSLSINANNDQLTLHCLNGGHFAHPSGGQFNVWTVVDAVNGWNLTQSPRASININQAGDLVLPLPSALDPTVAQNLEIRDQDTYCTDGSTYSHDFAWGASIAISFAPPTQTVTYNANSGVGSIAASVANGARNLSDGSGFTLSGYALTGWNTAANGSGTAVAAGASYTPSGNVTLYAQWTRIPTPPAPVFTSPIAAAPVGGILNLTGANLANVTSITVGNVAATVATSSTGQVTVKLPDLAPGKYDLTIKNADGGIRFIDGLVVPDPNAKVAPKPTNTYVASSAVKVTGSAPSAKQAAVLTEFVAQYKNAKQATVYIRTSKAGLAAAKKAAAAMLATVVKTLKNVKTGIVVDSTTEKATSLDLVVND